MRSPVVHCDDPEKMMQPLELELQNRAFDRGMQNTRMTIRLCGLAGIVLMIAAAFIALQLLASRMRTLSVPGRTNEFRNSEVDRR